MLEEVLSTFQQQQVTEIALTSATTSGGGSFTMAKPGGYCRP
ncbi:MAG: hypothetical protein ACLTZY_05750 [Alistipes indistinctus]